MHKKFLFRVFQGYRVPRLQSKQKLEVKLAKDLFFPQ